MNKDNKKLLTYIIYAFIVVGISLFLFNLSKINFLQTFINTIEFSSFDLRQTIVSKYKTPNKDIVIVAVDDETYEYIMNNYGSWPITRKVWADMINYVELAKPKNIIFDLLFIKPNLNDIESDKALVEAVKNNDNVYLSMNLDNYPQEVRKPPVLDEKLKLNLKEGEFKDSNYITFANARVVMDELSAVTDNIGLINVEREADGVIRSMTPVFKYNGEYYPNLSFRVALDMLNLDEIKLVNNSILLDENHYIPLDETQRAVLNWYGGSHTYKHISMWRVIDALKNNNTEYLKDFENKTIYIGTTATSLSDVKSVPTEYRLAGVELHTTFLNNVMDNNFIKKVPTNINLLISILMSALVGYCVLRLTSVLKTIVFLIVTLVFYGVLSVVLMAQFNLWIGVVLPYISTITIFVLTYCEKYILKSKDYEQTYKLAVTDGLTQLYNHRYFQEQMINNVNAFKRYGTMFSLILIDIDFFKKFNDTYGHQSGDCVLKQVANILKKNSRTSDIVCRYGGEEMAIILTNTNKEEAVITANKVCLAVRNNKFVLANNEKVNVTISVGVATVGENGEKPQEIIEFSDKCLYVAKENGRNQVVSEVD
ncbi:MAG: diguanylate cyclase [Candidatus Gastranaerophilales bacterium]|nr:diguanylate cyclase [Candidatus Gastranaerophilales bacterium]